MICSKHLCNSYRIVQYWTLIDNQFMMRSKTHTSKVWKWKVVCGEFHRQFIKHFELVPLLQVRIPWQTLDKKKKKNQWWTQGTAQY